MEKMRFIAAFSVVMLMLHGIMYSQYTGQITINPADVSTEQTDGWDIVSIEGCNMENEAGKPYLPVKSLQIAIPEDVDVTGIQILAVQQQELTGTYNIMPTQPEQIPGEPEPDFVNPDPDVYNINSIYPSNYIYSPTDGFRSGVHIAGILYYPLTYNPVTQKLYLTTQIQYQLVYTSSNHDPVKPRRMINNTYLELKENIKSNIENPNEIDALFQLEKIDNFNNIVFAPTEFPNFSGHPVEYVIITNENLELGFQEIADWKTQKGVPAVVRTVEWIYNNYPGVDQAEKVRNFIIDSYENWGTQFFMLGGDSDVVPIRGAWISPFIPQVESTGAFVPADMYFACLDGNWNADGDATFGEGSWNRENNGTFSYVGTLANIDIVDRDPDVIIGRVPIEDYTNTQGEYVELTQFKTKLFEYEKTSFGNENNVLLFSSMSSINGLQSAFSSYVNFTTRYKNDGYDNIDVLDEFNGNGPSNKSYHILCGLGHGGPTNFAASNGSLNRTHMDNLTNVDRGQILCLTHCSTMPWNKNTVVEHYINSENGGIAVTGNTHVGWASMVTSHNYKLIENLYNLNNKIGIAFKEVKADNTSSYYDGQNRMMFFAHSIASDPEMPVWTDVPDPATPLIVTTPTSIYTGEQTIQLSVDNLTLNTEVTICLYKENEVYEIENITGTGSTINVSITCVPDTPGDLNVTVTAKNYLPVELLLPVASNPNAHIFISDNTISGDEYIDAGETINLDIELSNSGLTQSNGVNATLSCTESFITIQNNQSSFGDIPAGTTVWNNSDFVFTVDATLEEDEVAEFTIAITDANSNTYNDKIYLEIKSPTVEQRSKSVVTTTNGDKVIEAGETVSFDIELFNNSLSNLQDVTAQLSSTSPYLVNIQQDQGNYGDLSSYQTETGLNEYVFEVSSTYPGDPEPINFDLNVTNSFGQQWIFSFNLLEKPDISDIVIDFRGQLTSISLFWTVYPDVLGYNIYRSDTETGEYTKLNTQILPIAYFEDAGLPELTKFYYKVSAVSLSGNESELSDPKQAWTSLAYHPDWLPVTVSNEDHGYFWGAPNAYDVDNDNEKEIFITSGTGDQEGNFGTIFAFEHDGEELYDIDENPTSVSGFANIGISMTSTPAIGDIDNDGITEVVFTTRMADPDAVEKRKLLVYKNEDLNEDGKPDLMWEKQIANKNFNGVILADIDGNNTLEIITPNQKGQYIEIFDHLGNNYSGWPVNTGESPVDLKAVSMPVAVDLNNDNLKEIIIGLEGGLYIWNSDGSNYLAQNPLNLNIPSGGRLDCPVIAADIDNDDSYEILFMSIQNTTGYIYAIESDGNLAQGWDNNNHSIDLSIASQTWAWPPSFVCGDINMDGNIEIVIADYNTLKVWDNIGNLVLDKTIPMLNCQYQQPLIADIDGTDTECEIIIPANNGTIHAFKLNGEPVLGWPLYRNSSTSIPFIDDIDNDQKNEIVAASGNDIYVWDSDGISDYNQWGSFRLNSYNNAVYVNSCYYSPNPLTLIADEDWNSDRILNSDLIIEDATLTIYSTVKITPSASVIVKPGSKLIINGGKLTNSCTDLWQGIQVWGNSSAHQYPDANGDYLQGYVELRNGAVVENAWEAIQPWNPDHWNETGGIIMAYGATFRNNRRAIQFMSYQNYDPTTGEHRPNQSVFKNCTFEATDSFDKLFNAPSHAFVSMYKVDGVKFYGCDFNDERSTYYQQFTQSVGIWTIDADFSVLPLCNDYLYDCWSCPTSNIDKSSFTGLNIGVYSTQSTTSSSYVIDRTNFINNLFGNLNVGNDNASVIRSRFEVGTKETVSPYYPMFGIINYGATGLTIQQNEFLPYEDLPSNIDFHTGIWNKDTGDDFNIIFKNDFSQMGYANLATGLNNNEEWPEIGLNYQCNTNTSNIQFDFFVNDGNGIASYQGTEEVASGNTFCQSSMPEGSDFYNEAKTAVNYFYYNGNNEDPVNYVNIYPEIAPLNNCDDVFGPTTHITLSQVEIDSYRQLYYYNKTEYDNTKYLFDVMKDGGDTPATISDIENAWPEETWELREQLLADSPHLSKKVLFAAADRTDVLPHTIMFEICIANPEEMRDEDFLDYLESKADPMPSYMVDDLREGADEDTYKSILQNELAGYARLWAEACNYILRDIVLDSTGIKYDSLRLWLENKGSLNSAYEIVDSYIAQDSLNNALVYLNNIPNNHDLSDYQQIEYNYYYTLKNILISAQQQGRNILQLDSIEVLSLVDIADSSVLIAGAQAQSILNFGYGYSYFMFPNLPTNLNMKQSNITEDNNSVWVKTQYERNFIEAYPNPASTWVTFEYSLPYLSTNVKIKIVDISGKPVKTIDLQSQFGQVTWDTRNIKSGLYVYSLFINNIKTEQRKLIINN